MTINDKDPSSTKARIIAIAIILALAATFALRPTKETQNPTPPPQEAKNEQMGPPQPPGGIGKTAGETPKAPKEPQPVPARDFANQAEAKAALAGMLPHQRDVTILTEIIQCESGWEHFRPTGEVKVASGNVGFGQLNAPTWKQWMIKNHGLDIYKEKENLKATVVLYLRSGTSPWKPYSGHCWLPKLAVQGIEL
jgi:hypothetical protein